MNLVGKTAVITGGARGLGKSFAESVLTQGGNVVVGDVQTNLALQTVNELQKQHGFGRAMFVKCDVTQEESVRDLITKSKKYYGHIDIFVNNAGISEENLKTILVNLHGVVLGTECALEAMSTSQGGRGGVIVNIGSTAGLTVVPFSPIYSATKYGVVGYSRAMAARKEDTEEVGVRVVCLCPSFTETEMLARSQETTGSGATNIVSTTGIMRVSRVAEAFLRLVFDEKNNGGVMAVTPQEMEYKYPRKWRASKL